MPTTAPRRRKDAEIIVKHNFGIGGLFGTDCYYGIGVFANRSGYRFLAQHFDWLAKRKIKADPSDPDPGSHVHLTPGSDLTDDIDFMFDTITPKNRTRLLKSAGATKKGRRRGPPFRQLAKYCQQSTEFFCNSWLKNDPQLRASILEDLTEAISKLEVARERILSIE